MSVFIAVLRGINVAGHATISMADLRESLSSLKLSKVRTYVQSGNVVFEAARTDEAKLERAIQAKLKSEYDLSVAVLVRSPRYFESVIAKNPFLKKKRIDPKKLHVTFLSGRPSRDLLAGCPSPDAQGDEYALGEREIFVHCPNGYGKTKLSNGFFERKLKLSATTRNWNTVQALLALCASSEQE